MGDSPRARPEKQISRARAAHWWVAMRSPKGNQPKTQANESAGAADSSSNASREPMNTIATLVQRTSSAAPLALAPLNSTSLRDQAYVLLKNAIADTDI